MITREARSWTEGASRLLDLYSTSIDEAVRAHCREEIIRMGRVLDNLSPVVIGATDLPDPPKVPI
jgi:hypothetical protein